MFKINTGACCVIFKVWTFGLIMCKDLYESKDKLHRDYNNSTFLLAIQQTHRSKSCITLNISLSRGEDTNRHTHLINKLFSLSYNTI
jgi:hypothetical protein